MARLANSVAQFIYNFFFHHSLLPSRWHYTDIFWHFLLENLFTITF